MKRGYVIASLLFIFVIGFVSADIGSGVIAHYKFDCNGADNAGTLDGTLKGGINCCDPGIDDDACYFDGVDDRVDVVDSSVINLQSTYIRSLSVWFKAEDTMNTQVLYEEGGGTNGFNIYLSNNTLFCGFWGSRITNKWMMEPFTDTDSWHHIVFVFDGTNGVQKMYLDNVEVDSSSNKGYIPYRSGDIGIGVSDGNTVYIHGPAGGGLVDYYNGYLDDLRIYGWALSSEDVEELYNLGNPPIEGCVDSDGGKDYYTKGEVTNLYCNGLDYIEEDICVKDNYGFVHETTENYLFEYYCDENDCGVSLDGTNTYYCPNGCEDGECLGDSNTACPKGWKCLPGEFARGFLSSDCEWEETEWCPDGCQNGGCIQEQLECTDTDGGRDRYLKGETCLGDECKEDYCWTNEWDDSRLAEFYCSEDLNWIDEDRYIYCPKGCNNGSCIKTVPVVNDVCQNLINNVANPRDFSIGDIDYRAGSWNNEWDGETWIDGEPHSFKEYSSGWSTYKHNDWDGEYYYENTYININVMVFQEENVNLESWIKDRTAYQICRVDSYWDYEDNRNYVYICTWDILRNNQDLDNYDQNSREVIWINDNVIVQMNIDSGRSLTDEEITKISEKRISDFLNDLKDNEFDYVGWEDFDVSYLGREFLSNTLKDCASDVDEPTREGTNDTCYPSWNCKLEPVICPPHGYQTRICRDYGCDSEVQEARMQCDPGMCSGCFIPRWFGDKYGNNKCIPYGFRFEQETGDFDEKWEEEEERDELYEGEEMHGSEGYSLEIISSQEAILTFYGGAQNNSYTLIPGEKVEIVIPFEEETVYVFYTNEIVLGTDTTKGYVDFTIKFMHLRRMYERVPMYCDIDGGVKIQRTVDYNGNWAKCQNNYECESNICSSGECIELQKMLDEASTYKSLGVRVLCKLAHLFSEDNYSDCIFRFLGEVVDEPATDVPPASGGGGGAVYPSPPSGSVI